MPLVDRKRPKIGDICEIETPSGFAYFQYTHKHTSPPKYGALIRVFDGIYSNRPSDFSIISAGSVQFSTFFPLGPACNRNIVKIVASEEVAAKNTSFPIFKVRGFSHKESKIYDWSLWDGVKTWEVGKLSKNEQKLPTRGIINDTLLIERITNTWRSENDYV